MAYQTVTRSGYSVATKHLSRNGSVLSLRSFPQPCSEASAHLGCWCQVTLALESLTCLNTYNIWL